MSCPRAQLAQDTETIRDLQDAYRQPEFEEERDFIAETIRQLRERRVRSLDLIARLAQERAA